MAFSIANDLIPAYKPQKFNDGTVKIYKATETSTNGGMPTKALSLQETLRYHTRTLGLNRYYSALKEGTQVGKVIRCPRKPALSTTDIDLLIAILQDDKQYEVKLIQWPEDVVPKSMDLSLERVVTEYAIV